MCRQLLEEGGGVCDCNIAGAANEYVNAVMEDEFFVIFWGLKRPIWRNAAAPLVTLLSQWKKPKKNKFFHLNSFLLLRPQMRNDKAWECLDVWRLVPHAHVLHKTWNAFYAIMHLDYTSVNILNEFRSVPVCTASHEVGKLCGKRISGCEWVLFLDWGTAAHMGWGRRKAACWAPRTGPGPWLWGGHWETIDLQWRGVLPDTSVCLVPTLEAFQIHNQNFSLKLLHHFSTQNNPLPKILTVFEKLHPRTKRTGLSTQPSSWSFLCNNTEVWRNCVSDIFSREFYYCSLQNEACLLPEFSLDSLLIKAEFEMDVNLSRENCSNAKSERVMHVRRKELSPLR